MLRHALVLGLVGVVIQGARLTAEDPFHPPQRLRADGEVIDTGEAWGHSGPCVEDVDGDGLDDLLVGDFGGKFHVYRNVGTEAAPQYVSAGNLQAGDEEASVRIYCCVGSQPRFADVDGDGLRDLISNSYDPGHAYLFRQTAAGAFAGREEMKDRAGVPIRSSPVQQQDFQSFGSFITPVDWDADGDADLMIGCFDGHLKLRLNEGDASEPRFASENVAVTVGDEPLKVEAHCCPAVGDWDDDGLWDLVVGSDDGSVVWFRNVGNAESPAFAAAETLVSKSEETGYNLLRFPGDSVLPGIRSQVELVDFNRDGQLDLLVGDFSTVYDLRDDLTAAERREVRDLVEENSSLGKECADRMQALRDDFAERYPGDELFGDEATEAWSREYAALRESDVYQAREAAEENFCKQMRPFLDEVRRDDGQSHNLAKSHGYVWLFLRK